MQRSNTLGMDQYVVWFNGQYHDNFYTNSNMKQAYKNYVSHLLNRVNSFSGIKLDINHHKVISKRIELPMAIQSF